MNEQLLHQLEILEKRLKLWDPHTCRACMKFDCGKEGKCGCRCGTIHPDVQESLDTMRKILTDDYFQVQ